MEAGVRVSDLFQFQSRAQKADLSRCRLERECIVIGLAHRQPIERGNQSRVSVVVASIAQRTCSPVSLCTCPIND